MRELDPRLRRSYALTAANYSSKRSHTYCAATGRNADLSCKRRGSVCPAIGAKFMLIAVILAKSTDVRLIALAVFGAGAGVYWFYKGFRLLQRKRLILDTPA